MIGRTAGVMPIKLDHPRETSDVEGLDANSLSDENRAHLPPIGSVRRGPRGVSPDS